MSLSNFYQNGTMYFPNEVSKSETISVLTVGNQNNNVVHTIDTSGNYTVTNQSGQSLLKFDSNANLIDSVLTQAIVTNTNAIENLQNLVSDIQSGEGQVQNLSSVLTVGNNAGNKNIVGVDAMSANSLSVGGINITTNGSSAVIPNLQTVQIQCSSIWLGNQNLDTRITTIENYLG
ncbi:hypothetical protein, partial [Clostridium sp.]|uniref:hypothetical protein n=1 Tax=Clostridium sp. TaxID=1506 RepID=UPI00284C775F